MWKLSKDNGPAKQELRQAFMETLADMMDDDGRILLLEADLGGASGSIKTVGSRFPERFFDVGISEANMMGMAGGLSMLGFAPFVHTFAPFASRRSADQTYLEGAYAGNSFTIYASDPGVCAEHNGGTHSTYEDVSLMRAMPRLEVFHPADPVQLSWLVQQLPHRDKVHYVRAGRKKTAAIYEDGSTFEIGKGNLLKEGDDVALVACGDMVFEALRAADLLKNEGISAAVVDMFTLKPFDSELFLEISRGKKVIVTMENHSTIGGLGSIAAECLAEAGSAVPLRRVGVQDKFGQVGTIDYLKQVYGLNAETAVKHVHEIFA